MEWNINPNEVAQLPSLFINFHMHARCHLYILRPTCSLLRGMCEEARIEFIWCDNCGWFCRLRLRLQPSPPHAIHLHRPKFIKFNRMSALPFNLCDLWFLFVSEFRRAPVHALFVTRSDYVLCDALTHISYCQNAMCFNFNGREKLRQRKYTVYALFSMVCRPDAVRTHGWHFRCQAVLW